MNLGISWRGGTYTTRRHLRSIPFSWFRPLASIPGVRLISLQHNPDAHEREEAERANVRVWDEAVSDLDELAALISSLDLVVTVDNVNLHLAGALGTTAWGLLGVSPEWRWLNEGTRTPWYPSTSLYRVRDVGGWDEIFADLVRRLSARAQQVHGSESSRR